MWLTSLCILVQSLGVSGGGVLCIGCGDPGFGLTLAAAHCGPLDECCDEGPAAPRDACEGQPEACWCFDVPVTGELNAAISIGAGDRAAAPDWAPVPAFLRPGPMPAPSLARAAHDGGARVRQLSPSARRTVLLV